MSWIYLAIISIFCTAFSSLFQKLVMKEDKSDPVLFSILFQVCIFLITFIFAYFNGFVLPPLNLTFNLIFGAVLYAIGVIFNFKAVKMTEVSNVTIIGTLSSIVSIALGIFLFKESFGFLKLLGTIFIIISIINLYWKKKKLTLNKGFIYAFVSAIFFGIAVVNDAFIIKKYDAISYTPVMSFLPALVMILFYPKTLLKIKSQLSFKQLVNLLGVGFFYSIAAVCFYLAIAKGANVSQISPINRASIITTVILAAIFLKERDRLFSKIVSALLVSIGVIMLI